MIVHTTFKFHVKSLCFIKIILLHTKVQDNSFCHTTIVQYQTVSSNSQWSLLKRTNFNNFNIFTYHLHLITGFHTQTDQPRWTAETCFVEPRGTSWEPRGTSWEPRGNLVGWQNCFVEPRGTSWNLVGIQNYFVEPRGTSWNLAGFRGWPLGCAPRWT